MLTSVRGTCADVCPRHITLLLVSPPRCYKAATVSAAPMWNKSYQTNTCKPTLPECCGRTGQQLHCSCVHCDRPWCRIQCAPVLPSASPMLANEGAKLAHALLPVHPAPAQTPGLAISYLQLLFLPAQAIHCPKRFCLFSLSLPVTQQQVKHPHASILAASQSPHRSTCVWGAWPAWRSKVSARCMQAK